MADIIDWDATFGNRGGNPFCYFKKIFSLMIFYVARVVISEARMNPDIRRRRDISHWNVDSTLRTSVRNVFESLATKHDFRDIERHHFVWVEPMRHQEPASPQYITTTQQILQQNIVSDSPAPEGGSSN